MGTLPSGKQRQPSRLRGAKMSTRIATVCLCVVGVLNASTASAQAVKLVARSEVEEQEKASTVRLSLKNTGDKDTAVPHAYGSAGVWVVRRSELAGMSIPPPTYLS